MKKAKKGLTSWGQTEIKHHHLLVGLLAAGLIGLTALVASTSQASETVYVRGIVKDGGDSTTINVYISHVLLAADPTKIRGLRTDVDVKNAKRYKWIVVKGLLTQVRTTSIPVPGQEVIIRGTLRSDDRITASTVVTNYRDFVIEGTLEGRTLDTGKTDSGWVTINVTSSIFKGVTPARKFKEASIKGTDLLIRVDESAAVTALGKGKHLDEVTANQQKVRIEGQLQDESTWTATKLNELNS